MDPTLWAPQVQEDHRVYQDLREIQVQEVLQEALDPQDFKAIQVLKVQQD